MRNWPSKILEGFLTKGHTTASSARENNGYRKNKDTSRCEYRPQGFTDGERPLITLRNVGVRYRRRMGGILKPTISEFWALKDVSLGLYQGEVLGVIGRNGAGKSTLLKLLAGIIKPDRGVMIDHGFRASLLSLQVGFAPHLTGRENAMLSGMLLGLSKAAIVDRLDAIIAFSELGEFIDQPLDIYSSGMRARLGFSIAYYTDPDILLIDEVLGVGDAEFQNKSSAAMHEKIRSNKTVILVSHSPKTIADLCDRAVWIDQGRTVAEGNPAQVLEAYAEATSATQLQQPALFSISRQSE